MIISKGDNKSVKMKDAAEDLPTITEDVPPKKHPPKKHPPKKHKPVSTTATTKMKKKISVDSDSSEPSQPKSVVKMKKKIGETSQAFSERKSIEKINTKVVGASPSLEDEKSSAPSSKRKSVIKKKLSSSSSTDDEELSEPSSKRKSVKKKKKGEEISEEESTPSSKKGRSPSPSPTSVMENNGQADQPQRHPSVGRGGRGRGGRGRGRGRSAPSERGVQRHGSDSTPTSGPSHHPPKSPISRKAQSMKMMSPKKPPNMMGLNGITNPKVPSSPRGQPPASPKRPPSMMGLNGSVHPSTGRGNHTRGTPISPGGRGRGRGGRGARPTSMMHLNDQMPPAPMRHPSTAQPAPTRLMSMQQLNRTGSGDGVAPPPLSRMESAPPNSKGTSSFYGNPPKPSSVLRSSSHKRKPVSRIPSASRTNPDGSVTTVPVNDAEEDEGRPMVSRLPSKLGSLGSFHSRDEIDSSAHSGRPGLGSMGSSTRFDEGLNSLRVMGKSYMGKVGVSLRGTQLSKFQSTRSILTQDQELEPEPAWKVFLRYIRIMPPHPDEKPIKRNIRLMTWAALFCDFLAAVVSITTYDGVSICCEEPVLSIAGNINWNVAIRVTTYVYLVLIFAEILPVIREGMPFNLLNPFIGFLITFAVFFDDRILEAVIMWIIEASAVSCEVAVYRLKVRLYNQREERLNVTEADMKQFRDGRKKKKLQRVREESGEDSDEYESSSGDSFHDETDDSEDPKLNSNKAVDLSNRRELRLMRDRRFLRQAQSEERRHLRYHFGGVAFNLGLVCITMLLILCIGRSGGLCIKDMQAPNVFKKNQLEVCYDCKGTTDVCQVCRDDGTSHCYYPYY